MIQRTEFTVGPFGRRLPVPSPLGDGAALRHLASFTANIANPNTRAAYSHAVARFLCWCERRDLALCDVDPRAVAAYIKDHAGSDATRNQHLAAIRRFFKCLVLAQVMPNNPVGSTPVLTATEVRRLIGSIKLRIGPEPQPGENDARPPNLIGLRDRAMIALMVYNFASIRAVAGMTGEDYYLKGKRWWLRLHEKGGKIRKVPAHPIAKCCLDAYIRAAGVEGDREGPLFRSVVGRSGRLTGRRLSPRNSYDMLRRRARLAGLPDRTCCHTLRATGITDSLENGGTIGHARRIAAQDSPPSTKLYGRTCE